MDIIRISSWVVFGSAFVWLIPFCLITYYRLKEEAIHKKIEKESVRIKNLPITNYSIEGELRNLNNRYKFQLEKLKRDREFIRDIIPFLKK